MAALYAWSNIQGGGKVDEINTPFGKRNVVLKRHVIEAGEKITPELRKKLNMSDEEFEHLKEIGVIRNYPIPEGASASVSPARAFMSEIVDERGDIRVDRLMEMGMSHPPAINPPAEEGKELEVPQGV